MVTVPGKAGDLVIWNSLLPHGNAANTSARPRLAQYITMMPAGADGAGCRERVAAWEGRLSSGRGEVHTHEGI